MRFFKYAVVFLCIVFAVCFVIIAAMIVRQNIYDIIINDNANSITYNVKYRNPQIIDDVPLIEQEITCGYAVIEMAAKYLGYDISENSLYEDNGKKITTSTNGGFYTEIKKHFPDYVITRYSNLKNTEIIDKIYDSLEKKMPVIFTFAAQNKNLNPDERTWELHYGVITGMDMPDDKININNPYGYTDSYSLKDFLAATRYENYQNMSFYLKLGFAFGLFSKNTVYIIENPDDIIADNENEIEISGDISEDDNADKTNE